MSMRIQPPGSPDRLKPPGPQAPAAQAQRAVQATDGRPESASTTTQSGFTRAQDRPESRPAADPHATAVRARAGRSAAKAARSAAASDRPLLDRLHSALKQVGQTIAGAQDKVCRSIGEAVNRMHGPDSKGRIGWLQAAGQRPSQDVTARFDELAKAAAAGDRTLPPDARDYTYLLVPGLMTERFPGYFDENQNRLRELGLNVSRVPLDTDASVETNARVVRDAILEAAKGGKKVVLLGHSKGGVDTAAALALYPELRPHVRSVVAMQAPYGGSPIAHDIQNCPELKGVADRLLQSAFQGDAKALSDLSYDRRREFLVRHPYPEDVPTVSLATSSSHPAAGTASAATYIRDRYGERSDGLVAAKDAEIPGSAVVRLENMDHAGAAMRGVRGVCSPYPPGDVTQALVTLALTTPGR